MALVLLLGLGGTPLRAELALRFDLDGSCHLVNEGPAAIFVNGYHLHTEHNLEIFDPQAWLSIEDQVALDPAEMMAIFGPAVLQFGEANPMPTSLAELAFPLTHLVFQPGQSVSLGKPLSEFPPPAEFHFAYSDVTAGVANFRVVDGRIRLPSEPRPIVPEPTGLTLLAFGSAGLLAAGPAKRGPPR
jgi:hypothetical protein